MLRILFHRTSPVVRFLEFIGVLNSILYLRKAFPRMDVTTDLFLFLLATYIFVRLCEMKNWYPQEDRSLHKDPKIGIEVHFQKALVPVSYILAIASFFCLLQIPVLALIIVLLADLMMLVVAPVNGILIYFHQKDCDSTPINFFSSNQYLKQAATGEKTS